MNENAVIKDINANIENIQNEIAHLNNEMEALREAESDMPREEFQREEKNINEHLERQNAQLAEQQALVNNANAAYNSLTRLRYLNDLIQAENDSSVRNEIQTEIDAMGGELQVAMGQLPVELQNEVRNEIMKLNDPELTVTQDVPGDATTVDGPGEPEPVEPETIEPEIIESEPIESETIEPEIIESEPIESETIEPEIIESEPIESETIEPEPIEPETIEPEVIEPEVEEEPIVMPIASEPAMEENKEDMIDPFTVAPVVEEPKNIEEENEETNDMDTNVTEEDKVEEENVSKLEYREIDYTKNPLLMLDDIVVNYKYMINNIVAQDKNIESYQEELKNFDALTEKTRRDVKYVINKIKNEIKSEEQDIKFFKDMLNDFNNQADIDKYNEKINHLEINKAKLGKMLNVCSFFDDTLVMIGNKVEIDGYDLTNELERLDRIAYITGKTAGKLDNNKEEKQEVTETDSKVEDKTESEQMDSEEVESKKGKNTEEQKQEEKQEEFEIDQKYEQILKTVLTYKVNASRRAAKVTNAGLLCTIGAVGLGLAGFGIVPASIVGGLSLMSYGSQKIFDLVDLVKAKSVEHKFKKICKELNKEYEKVNRDVKFKVINDDTKYKCKLVAIDGDKEHIVDSANDTLLPDEKTTIVELVNNKLNKAFREQNDDNLRNNTRFSKYPKVTIDSLEAAYIDVGGYDQNDKLNVVEMMKKGMKKITHEKYFNDFILKFSKDDSIRNVEVTDKEKSDINKDLEKELDAQVNDELIIEPLDPNEVAKAIEDADFAVANQEGQINNDIKEDKQDVEYDPIELATGLMAFPSISEQVELPELTDVIRDILEKIKLSTNVEMNELAINMLVNGVISGNPLTYADILDIDNELDKALGSQDASKSR